MTLYIHSRKPISIVKNSHVFLDCENRTLATHNNTCTSWITQVLLSPPHGSINESQKQFLLPTRLMGSLQSQQRRTWGCWTRPTFSPTHSSCSSAGDSLHQDINICFFSRIEPCILQVCGRTDEFALLLELGDDIQVSHKSKPL